MTACPPNRSMDLVAFLFEVDDDSISDSLEASAGKSRALNPIGAWARLRYQRYLGGADILFEETIP
jgi:hypothetical protein